MTTSIDREEFWESLLDFIQQRSVIPIVGAELLTLQVGGKTVPMYRVVAERLLHKYGLTVGEGELREHQELNDAVCMLAAARPGGAISDLYRPVHKIVQEVVAEQKELPLPLHQLAAISHFDLFVTTTPDDILARTLDAVRFGGTQGTDQIEYAPKLPTDRWRDKPEQCTSRYTGVFYLFGKASIFPFYAIHDEDALEFAYTLQASVEPKQILSDLRSRNLLLIGCTFADWLSRFFLRMFNSERLSSNQRVKREFLVGDETTRDSSFSIFLERFSRASSCYPADAPSFVSELYRRWAARNPMPQAASMTTTQAEAAAGMTAGGTIFISYSSEDVGAAQRLFEELMEIGGDVAWFDKSALKPGDEWNKQIRGAIQRCSIFLPLISASTERRDEGYFRMEWADAAERARRIQGRKFIFPIVIDADYAGALARYQLVPDQFNALQYSHAPAGHLTDQLKAELKEQLRKLRRSRVV